MWWKMFNIPTKFPTGTAKEVRLMTGEYRQSLDSKGRVFIPAKMREEAGDVLYVTLSMEKCLSVYSRDSWNALCEKVSAMPYIRQKKMRPLFAFASKCEADAQGRILIPANLREFANIEKNVTIVGCNNHIELWNADYWDEVSSEEITPDNIAKVMEELEF